MMSVVLLAMDDDVHKKQVSAIRGYRPKTEKKTHKIHLQLCFVLVLNSHDCVRDTSIKPRCLRITALPKSKLIRWLKTNYVSSIFSFN